MDTPPKPPLTFANRVIKELIENLVGDDYIITGDDYLTIRAAYRKGGGIWERLSDGDIIHIRLLANIVLAWGKMPDRKKNPE